MKAPPKWKFEKVLKSSGSTVLLHKVTVSLIEDEFGQAEESEETYSVRAEIQPITLEDVTLLPAGMVDTGDAWGFFLPTYSIDDVDISVEVNDYVTFSGIKYLVARLENYYFGGDTIYSRAFLKKQVGQ